MAVNDCQPDQSLPTRNVWQGMAEKERRLVRRGASRGS
jgi:hypothetical protein